MLIRVGNRGFNTDQLQHWTYAPVPEPEPTPEPEPPPAPALDEAQRAPQPDDGRLPDPELLSTTPTESSTRQEEPAPQGTATLTLVFLSGEVALEGEEADKLNAYLTSKAGAVF